MENFYYFHTAGYFLIFFYSLVVFQDFFYYLLGNIVFSWSFCRKQYIFHCQASLPGMGSRIAPQRMYFCVNEKGHFRMGTSVTEDLVLQ